MYGPTAGDGEFMLNWDSFEKSLAGPKTVKKVAGRWAPIRVRPYMHSDDLFTVGVVFKQNRKAGLTTVLIENFEPFGCLYGDAGIEQFQWLLAGVKDALTNSDATVNLGPHVSFGSWEHAEGISANSITENLFSSVVTLRVKQKSEQLVKADSSGLNTPQIRKRLERAFVKSNASAYTPAWHPNGLERLINGRTERLDLPLWAGQDLIQPDIFGTVISTCYFDETYRGFFLNGAFRDMSVMYDLLSATGKGGLFILRPKTVPIDLRKKIDLEIDRVGALLHKHGANVEVEDDVEALCRKVIYFVQ